MGHPSSSGTLVNSFRYTGREFDSETGLYYYRARYYEQEIGRFASEDILQYGGEDANFYRYALNSPANRTDPSGLKSCLMTSQGLVCWKDRNSSGGVIFYPSPPSRPSSIECEFASYRKCVGEKLFAEGIKEVLRKKKLVPRITPPRSDPFGTKMSPPPLQGPSDEWREKIAKAKKCLLKYPLAGLARDFRDIDVGKTFSPSPFDSY